MSRICIQFFGLSQEILDTVSRVRKGLHLRVVLVDFFPDYRVQEIEEFEDLEKRLSEFGPPRQVCLCKEKPNLAVSSPFEFKQKNSDWLILSIGKQKQGELQESSLVADISDEGFFKIGKKIAAEFRKMTKAGMWIYNPKSKAKGFYRNCRYTDAAIQSAATGIKLVPLGQGNYAQATEPMFD